MHAALVYQRTAKGTLEWRNPASALTAELRALLSRCDGRTDLTGLAHELGPRLRDALQRLESGGYVAACVAEDADLDFTSPAALTQLQAEAEARARAEAAARARAEEAAREAAAAKARVEAQAREQAEAESHAIRAAQAREAAEAAARTADAERHRAAQQANTARSAESRASTQARMEAALLAEARAAADARAFAAADAEAREALAQAQAMALRAREEAQARARAESEALARAHAEAHARAMVEAQLKAMSAALAQAQALARDEADARARLTADLQAREAAEARARAEAAAQARTEVETKLRAELARLDAEAQQARAEAEARAESERRARAAAEALAEEERRARAAAESEAAAERARRDAAVRQAAQDAEARTHAAAAAQLDAQRRAHAAARAAALTRMEEERAAREAAESRAQAEAEARIAQESAMQVHAEQLVQQRLAQERIAREHAERAADTLYRTQAAERARNAAAARPPAPSTARTRMGKPIDRLLVAKLSGAAVLGLAIAAALLAPLVPLDARTARFEKAAAEMLGQPVRIGHLRYRVLPMPELVAERVVFGASYGSRIERVAVSAWPWALYTASARPDSVKVSGLVLDAGDLVALGSLLDARRSGSVRPARMEFESARLTLQDLPFSITRAAIHYASDGSVRSATLVSGGARLEAVPAAGRTWRIALDAHRWRPPLGPALDFDALALRGVIDGGRLRDARLEGRIAGGDVNAVIEVDWRSGVRAAGSFELTRIDLQRALAACTPHFSAHGTLMARGQYAVQSATLGKLLQAPHVTADFRLLSGTLDNVDVVRALQQVTAKGIQGGRTRYEQISGSVEVAGDRYRYRRLKLTSGPMTAAGDIELAPGNRLAGRIAAEVAMATRTAIRGVLTVGGTLDNPVLRPY